MSKDEDAPFIPLARSISDGSPVDWRSAERDAAGEEISMLRRLRVVADIVEAHRRQHSGAAVGLADSPMGITAVAIDPRVSASAPAEHEGVAAWGPLEILEKVGEGAFGEVYRARDTRLDREVALKLLRTGSSDRDEVARAVIEEGRLLARVRHPNVATVHGAERHEGRVGLWMEFIRGRTLSDLLADQGVFGAREAGLVAVEVCRALAAVHRAGLVHRDVKAENVMREEGGRIVLMDFSAGRDLTRVTAGEDRTVSGTPLYIAPEVFRGDPATMRSDVYGLGVLLYHLVTLAYPVDAKTLHALRDAHLAGAQRPLGELRPDLPSPFMRVVEKALAQDPNDRFPSAAAMEQALASALGIEGAREARAEAQAVVRPRPSRRWLPLGLAAACIVVAAVISGLILKRSQIPDSSSAEAIEQTAGGARSERRSVEPSGSATTETAKRTGAEATGATATHDAPVAAPAPPPTTPASASLQAAGSYTVEAAFFRGADRRRSLEPSDRIRVGDPLSLEFKASRSLYVYVIDEDEAGVAALLFPVAGSSIENPLQANRTYLLPGELAGAQNYWRVTSAGGREHFLLVASAKRLADFERETVALIRPSTGDTPQYAQLTESAKLTLRGVTGLMTGPSPRPAGSQSRLFEMAERLAARSEVVHGSYVRRLDLDNPGP